MTCDALSVSPLHHQILSAGGAAAALEVLVGLTHEGAQSLQGAGIFLEGRAELLFQTGGNRFQR